MTDFLASLYASEVDLGVIAARMIIAALLGAVLGVEREMLSRPAGMRTFMLVSLAAATFTVVTFELVERARAEGASNVDPIRIIEAVTAGVAFLAAGAVIQARGRVHGVTTGAGLWLSGAIGTACGVGAYPIAILAAALGFVVLSVLRPLDRLLPRAAPPPGGDHSADRD
jgi:putative Mg2+ transporter-C (MgtC) family protein